MSLTVRPHQRHLQLMLWPARASSCCAILLVLCLGHHKPAPLRVWQLLSGKLGKEVLRKQGPFGTVPRSVHDTSRLAAILPFAVRNPGYLVSVKVKYSGEKRGAPGARLQLCSGTCFLLGGMKFKEQTFNAVANKASASLLFLAAIALIVPTGGRVLYGSVELSESEILNISYTTAIILILMCAPPPGWGMCSVAATLLFRRPHQGLERS